MIPKTVRQALEILVFLEYFRYILKYLDINSKYIVVSWHSLIFWEKKIVDTLKTSVLSIPKHESVSCFGRRVGLDDAQRSLPTPTIL